MIDTRPAFGPLLQTWRRRRRLSQLDLSLEAGVSQRHISFVESGRSSPSRDMVLHLAEALEVPPRERNALLVAAGYAPVLVDRGLDHPDLAVARRAVEAILKGHEPNPALAVDRHWSLVAANAAVAPLLEGVPADLLGAAINVLRLSLHPRGLAGRIANLRDWRAHILARLHRQVDVSGDPVLAALMEELKGYPVPPGARPPTPAAALWGGHAFALELAAPDGTVLRLITTTTVFGTAVDITLSELAIESFFPADEPTAAALARIAGAKGEAG
jgi:transcriptional regulator with XRE-family HTH domain